MGGSGTLRGFALLALALSGTTACQGSRSSDDDDAGEGGMAGHTVGGTAGQGGAAGSTGGSGTAGQAGSTAATGGTSGSGGASGSSDAGSAGSKAGSGGNGGDGGGTATGGAIGNAGAAGESGDGSGGGSGGRGGSPASIDCSGSFGEPHLVFDPESDQFFSPTLTANELELVYAAGDGGTLRYYRSKRSSKAEEFAPGPGEPLPELDAACVPSDSRTIDLTSDGLRAYLVCYGAENPNSNELRIAARATLDAPFVLDPKGYGSVGPSAGVAPGELTLYSSSLQPGTMPALAFERTATSEPFGDGIAIPGLEDVLLLTPDMSADGLSLFGNVMGAIVVATRLDTHDSFSLTDSVIAAPASWISATISEDCRSLYAVRQSPGVTLEVFER